MKGALFSGMKECIAGVDEVGRGPLAGPVLAAAVILNPDVPIAGLKDSKKLSAAKREHLSELIWEHALAVALGRAEVEEIDRLNILQASLLAMHRAVSALKLQPSLVLVDGNRCPKWSYRSRAIIGGDNCIPEISAASIVAKVARDAEMLVYHEQFPGYGFDRHKGYGTALHLHALQTQGYCSIHRKSFSPIKELLKIESERL